MEAANRYYYEGKIAGSISCILLASIMAWIGFPSTDPRQIASRANRAFAFRVLGMERLACQLYQQSIVEWKKVFEHVDHIRILPRARSSMHHQRMEAQHWVTYQENIKTRMKRFVVEAGECLAELETASPVSHRLFSRWKGEKYPVYDDTRKLLAACLLLISPQIS